MSNTFHQGITVPSERTREVDGHAPSAQKKVCRQRSRCYGVGLVGLASFAFAIRLAAVAVLTGPHRAPVTYEHGTIAANLVEGHGFSIDFLGVEGPTSQQAPLYPTMLALFYLLFGVESAAAILAMQLVQCATGTALALSVTWLGWRLIPERREIGWCAGILAAVYPTHVYMVTHIQVCGWVALLLVVVVAISTGRKTVALRTAVVTGATAGVLLLFDPIMVLALPMVFFCLWRRARHRATAAPRHGPFLYVAAATAACAVVIGPWIWRNWRVHGEPVFIKSTFGYAFWQGNNPASWGTDKVPKASAERLRRAHDFTLRGVDRALWEARHETLYIDDVVLKPKGNREFQGLSELARSRLLGARAVKFIRQHPQQYLLLCVQRLRYFLLFDETNPKAAHPLYRLATVAWLTLALIGVFASRRHWHAIGPLIGIFAVVMLFHALTISSARFRIPVEALSFVWAAIAVLAPGRFGRSRAIARLRRRSAPIRHLGRHQEPAAFHQAVKPRWPVARQIQGNRG